MPVTLVPGHHFFTEVAPVAPGTAEAETAGLAALALEGSSPFPAEQLASGFYGAAKDGGVVAFAALRRKFTAEQEAWRNSLFVVPDFATFLPCGEAEPRIVVLETEQAVTALKYGSGSRLPERILSRPVSAEPGGEDGISLARDQALARLPADGRRVVRYRLGSPPCLQHGSRFIFTWKAVEGTASREAEEASFDAAEMWGMDLRDAEFLVTRRRDFQWNRIAWNAFVGLFVAIGVLAVGELAHVGGLAWLKQKRAQVDAQAPIVQVTGDNNAMLKKLDAYGRDKPQPLEMLDLVNQSRHESIVFTRFVCEGWQLKISAYGTDVGQINALGSALKTSPEIKDATLTFQNTNPQRSDFTLIVQFRPGFNAQPAAPGPVANAAGAGVPSGGAQPAAPETVTVQP